MRLVRLLYLSWLILCSSWYLCFDEIVSFHIDLQHIKKESFNVLKVMDLNFNQHQHIGLGEGQCLMCSSEGNKLVVATVSSFILFLLLASLIFMAPVDNDIKNYQRLHLFQCTSTFVAAAIVEKHQRNELLPLLQDAAATAKNSAQL